eukprot:Polyplicarium_translucidae@DN2007_c0_g1_i1.p2
MEPLPDPKCDRVVKDIEPPPFQCISDALLFPDGRSEKPDWKALKAHLIREGRVKKEDCLDLISKVSERTGAEPNLLKLKDPITGAHAHTSNACALSGRVHVVIP